MAHSNSLAGRSTHPVDVIVMGASAGGMAATSTIFRGLPAELSVPILMMLHLPPNACTVDFYGRLGFAFEWVRAGSALLPRKVLVCPPRSFVELLPDGTCQLSSCPGGAIERPIDRLFDSAARSFGHRAIGVILTGMGQDGAAGARELHAAGGRVLIQSEASAEHPGMPRAAIEAGAADLVVPLQDMAQMLVDVVAGTPHPKMRAELEAVAALFTGSGLARSQLREIDWSTTLLGPVRSWPQSLRSTVRTALSTRVQMCVFWGPEFVMLANDAYLPSLGDLGPVQGRPACAVWQDTWNILGPELAQVIHTGEALRHDDKLWSLRRHGFLEEIYFAYCLSPLYDDDGAVAGVLFNSSETTARVLAERRLKTLQTLSESAAGVYTTQEACARAVAALADNPKDLPLALIYLLDRSRNQAILAAATGVELGTSAAPHWLELEGDPQPWPVSRAISEGAPITVDDLAARMPALTTGPWPEPLRCARILPLRPVTGESPSGIVVLGFSPRLVSDEPYRDFFNLVASRIAASLADARAREHERERLERLAELDRAKTEFFANVSHEFRTPLTLLLAPLQDVLHQRDSLPGRIGREVEVAARNALRLLGLVNNLLDFSQIEARRQLASLEVVDLGSITMDVASAFRSAIEAAGLRFRIECDPRLPLVPVNREMWERVVSNLLSNAFKFTFEGEICLTLRPLSLHAELIVSDTGIGIPAGEMPNIFKRFHRVRGARARTAEGSGIGLAIVADLVKRMGGQLRVHSKEGQRTVFTIWMPYKSARAFTVTDSDAAAAAGSTATQPRIAADLASEASRWDGAHAEELDGISDDLMGPPQSIADAESKDQKRSRIVVVDDNADMRQYLRRLLAPRWEIEVAVDGAAGLASIKRRCPDIILADVMMPVLNGFELLKRVREDPQLRHTPVVLITARAGEEAAIKGLLAGADDYIAKPFSPRELIARVQAAIDRARADLALRESEERFRAIVSQTAAGICRAAPDGTLIFVNRKFCEMLGYDEEQVIGKSVWELTDPSEVVAESKRRFQRLFETGETFEIEMRLICQDGSLLWTSISVAAMRDASGNPRSAVAVILDIALRKRTEQALARNQELERWSKVTVGRELRMIELKKEVNMLRRQLGEAPPYSLAFESSAEDGHGK